MVLSEMYRGLLHLFFPILCEGCNKQLLAGEAVLCLNCSAILPRTEYHHQPDNETALRFAGRISFEHATSFAFFSTEGLLQHLLHGLKYRNKKDIGTYLGIELGHELNKTDWIKGIDTIIPVPLHTAKQATRGYNQSALIATGIGSICNLSVLDNVLTRQRNTASQTKKTRAERVINMNNAFIVKNKEKIAGKHIMLIDDVLTTGATLEACANALLDVGIDKISIATVGIAVD